MVPLYKNVDHTIKMVKSILRVQNARTVASDSAYNADMVSLDSSDGEEESDETGATNISNMVTGNVKFKLEQEMTRASIVFNEEWALFYSTASN